MPAFTSKLSDKEYTKILQDEDFGPASFKEVADAFLKMGLRKCTMQWLTRMIF